MDRSVSFYCRYALMEAFSETNSSQLSQTNQHYNLTLTKQSHSKVHQQQAQSKLGLNWACWFRSIRNIEARSGLGTRLIVKVMCQFLCICVCVCVYVP